MTRKKPMVEAGGLESVHLRLRILLRRERLSDFPQSKRLMAIHALIDAVEAAAQKGTR